MNRVYVLDTRSCFTHGVSDGAVATRIEGPVFYRLAWGDLHPLFGGTAVADNLIAQLKDS